MRRRRAGRSCDVGARRVAAGGARLGLGLDEAEEGRRR